MHPETARQTGRTTRMLEEAIREADAGKYVTIVAYDTRSSHHLLKRCLELCDGELIGTNRIYLKKRGSILFASPDILDVDWEHVEAEANLHFDLTLIDHACIERRFSKLWEMAHRYDLEGAA